VPPDGADTVSHQHLADGKCLAFPPLPVPPHMCSSVASLTSQLRGTCPNQERIPWGRSSSKHILFSLKEALKGKKGTKSPDTQVPSPSLFTPTLLQGAPCPHLMMDQADGLVPSFQAKKWSSGLSDSPQSHKVTIQQGTLSY
jgi:hypothetical protein